MHDSPAINPFAAPDHTSAHQQATVTKNKRASELVLRHLCRSLAIAEVSYALGLASLFASSFLPAFIPGFSESFGILASFWFLPIVFFAVTWICLIGIHGAVQGWVGAVGLAITFPIPLIGTIVFCGESKHANKFLYRNGYQRTFVGAKPDPEERQRMEADANYSPQVYFDSRGQRRSGYAFTLSSACLVATIGFFLISLVGI